MKNLLYKEFKLASHPTTYIFLLLSAMLLIPNYPYIVTFFYTCLGVFFVCLTGRENHDIDYSVSLPVRKKDVVTARIFFIVIIELLQAAVAIPFAIIRSHYPAAMLVNQAGSAASFAMFGFAFVALGVFNIIFLTLYYKNPDKVGRSFFGAAAVVFVFIVLDVILSHVPALMPVLTTYGASYIGAKLGILFGGMAVYALLTFTAYKISVKSFVALDL